ncbi:hypothetical protein SAMN05880558_10254 [Aeromonas sp. RU39B]|jgi:hypothetical protein|uniref:hypothetical protein n=1 Tax=Aeromonas sp. RU39B TaxID=1907416 RepID=UPI00095549A4|nr:hypothetical protein [Aeromonas sp. RU39B]SIQ11698.1 hypothetical protein SAMN05880558_10254 [Aeromonas sp. RU39B]
MKKKLVHCITAAALCGVYAFSYSTMAADTSDLNYQDVTWAKQELRDRGFVKGAAPSNKIEYWWNADDQQCVRLEIQHDKISDVSDEMSDECGSVVRRSHRHSRFNDERPNNDRAYDDRDDDDRGEQLSVGQMPGYCLNYAAKDMGKYKNDVTTLPAERTHGQFVVPGQSDDVFFECNFSRDGHFLGMAIKR